METSDPGAAQSKVEGLEHVKAALVRAFYSLQCCQLCQNHLREVPLRELPLNVALLTGGFACAPTWGCPSSGTDLCYWGRAGLAVAPLALLGCPGSIWKSVWFSLYSPQRFAAVKWGYRISSASGLVTGKRQAPLQPLPHSVISAHPSALPQTFCPKTEWGICRETKGAWLYGDVEAERGRTGAWKYPGEQQGGELFMSTPEQCWHRKERVETSRNKLGLEMQRFPSNVGGLNRCLKGAGTKAWAASLETQFKWAHSCCLANTGMGWSCQLKCN